MQKASLLRTILAVCHSNQQLKRQEVKNSPSPLHAPFDHKPSSSAAHYDESKMIKKMNNKKEHKG